MGGSKGGVETIKSGDILSFVSFVGMPFFLSLFFVPDIILKNDLFEICSAHQFKVHS
jgi:hypothetical protein